jgi:Ser/Thr protein kinase RdoA (MazF antagonist)
MPELAVTDPASPTPYAGLTPEVVLAVAEELGLQPDGRLFALNSYENRVYRLGREAAEPVVLKFYRAGRWSDAQILEEHAFATELAAADIAVVAPIALGGDTLHHCRGFRVAAFPLRAGTAPDLDQPGARELLGRTLGRMHARGSVRRFVERPALTGERLGGRARRVVLASGQLPAALRQRYKDLSAMLIEHVLQVWEPLLPLQTIRLHGDCHLGNILWQPSGPVFVDLDDCLQGPAIQDLWMFLSGNADEQRRQWSELLAGYEQFAAIDYAELRLIEALRSVRMLNHAAWIAERWRDPAFPRAFPWFGEPRFWEQHLNDLAEQCAAVVEPPLLAV